MNLPVELIERGLEAWMQGNSTQAIRCLRRGCRSRPDMPQWWAILGDLELHQELYAAAARSFDHALRAHANGEAPPCPVCGRRTCGPPLDDIHAGLGRALAILDRPDEAEASFRRALAFDPLPKHAIALADLLDAQARREESRVVLVHALRQAPDSAALLSRLGLHHQWTRPWRAECYYRRAVRRNPDAVVAWAGLGLLLSMRLAADEAEACLALATANDDGLALPHVYLGHHRHRQGRIEEALEAYRQGARVAPGDPHPFFAMGDVYVDEKRWGEALAAYEEALRLDPACGDAWLRLGFLHAERGRAAEARRCLERGLAIVPDHGWADDARECLAELGD